MEQFLIVADYDGETKTYAAEHADTVAGICEVLRDLEHHYEVYHYDSNVGYVRTTRYPAQI